MKLVVAYYHSHFIVDFLYLFIDFYEDESFNKGLHFSKHYSAFACHFFTLVKPSSGLFNPQFAHSSFEMKQFLSFYVLTSFGVQFCGVDYFKK